MPAPDPGIQRTDSKQAWLVVAAVTLVLTFTAGVRLLPGIVLKPVTSEFGWTRSEMMIAITINMVVLSILQPFMGFVTDRVGAKTVLVAGTALLGAIMLPLSRATELWHFYLYFGVFGAIGLAAVSPVNVTSLVSAWFVERRGTALSISTSGSAFGQLMIVPAGTWLLTTTTWDRLYLILGLILLAGMVPVAFAFVKSNKTVGKVASGPHGAAVRSDTPNSTLKEALAGSAFWLLAFGFFVCGFTMAFANAHFMAYADDMGMATTRAADIVAATALFSILGSFVLGIAADRHPRKRVLAVTYALRGISFALLWILPVGPLLFVYAMVLGISWTATTPLTAAISADLYGRKNIGVIFGTMFSFMNIGFGAGSFLDGLVYDALGSYRVALLANAALGLLAAAAVMQVAHLASPRPRDRRAIGSESYEGAPAD